MVTWQMTSLVPKRSRSWALPYQTGPTMSSSAKSSPAISVSPFWGFLHVMPNWQDSLFNYGKPYFTGIQSTVGYIIHLYNVSGQYINDFYIYCIQECMSAWHQLYWSIWLDWWNSPMRLVLCCFSKASVQSLDLRLQVCVIIITLFSPCVRMGAQYN